MKNELQIIGAKAINKDTVEVYCIPYTSPEVKQKRPSVFDLARGGAGVQELMQEAEAKKSRITVFFVTLDQWRNEFKNKILTKISMNIDCEVFLDDK